MVTKELEPLNFSVKQYAYLCAQLFTLIYKNLQHKIKGQITVCYSSEQK